MVPTNEDHCVRFECGLNEEIKVLFSTLEIKDIIILMAKAQRVEMMIHERNKVKDRERDKHGAIESFLVVGFKRLKNVKSFCHTPFRDLQTVGFH